MEANGLISPVNVAAPLNRALVLTDNVLMIQPVPPGDPADFSDPSEMIIDAKLKLYSEDDVSAPENGEVLDSQSSEGLTPIEFIFDNEKLDFSNTFRKSVKVEDEDWIETYALKLKDLFENSDIDQLMIEFEPKLKELALAYYEPFSEYKAQFSNYMRYEIIQNSPKMDWDEKMLRLVPYCDKRLWELRVGDSEFVITEPDSEGYENVVRVFVGVVEDELKILR